MSSPRVSVVMPVYNSESYLQESVESILAQTFSDFELLCIDDGSTDGSYAILAGYAARDQRIVLLQNEKNSGQSYSANRAFELARGEYIARMDADDISLPARLAQQVAFLDAHPEVGVCGTWIKFFGNQDGLLSLPVDDNAIQCFLFHNSPVANPSSMMRGELVRAHRLRYDSTFEPAEDYAFWAEAATFTAFANLPEVLLHYRTHSTQSSSVRRRQQMKGADRVRLGQLARLGIEVTDEQANFHLGLIRQDAPLRDEVLPKIEPWIQELLAANQRTGTFPEPNFSRMLARIWSSAWRSATKLDRRLWNYYWASPLSDWVQLGSTEKLKFGILCAFPWLSPVRRSNVARRARQGAS